jgi:hypothetical protein
MGVAGFSMSVIVFPVRVAVLGLAFKCLPFSSLALFGLLRRRVLRIVYCITFRCVIQIVFLNPLPLLARRPMLLMTEVLYERGGKVGVSIHIPQTISLRDVAIGVNLTARALCNTYDK